MKRRDLLAASCVAGLAPLSRLAAGKDAAGGTQQQYLELRQYVLEAGAKAEAFEAFLGKALIPALNRMGIKPVGVFKARDGKSPDLHVLLQHPSLESVATATAKLVADAAFLKAGEKVLHVPMKDPAFKRVESSLMLAFEKFPKLERPSKKETRIFELRIYESHSILKGQKKIEMFNGGGEIAVFLRTGLTPVFFGEALVGSGLPNLTYMLGFDDEDARKAAWGRFGKSPGWKKLRSDPVYKDTVSRIRKTFLVPAACSQI